MTTSNETVPLNLTDWNFWAAYNAALQEFRNVGTIRSETEASGLAAGVAQLINLYKHLPELGVQRTAMMLGPTLAIMAGILVAADRSLHRLELSMALLRWILATVAGVLQVYLQNCVFWMLRMVDARRFVRNTAAFARLCCSPRAGQVSARLFAGGDAPLGGGIQYNAQARRWEVVHNGAIVATLAARGPDLARARPLFYDISAPWAALPHLERLNFRSFNVRRLESWREALALDEPWRVRYLSRLLGVAEPAAQSLASLFYTPGEAAFREICVQQFIGPNYKKLRDAQDRVAFAFAPA
jgi:hypothetical protein